MVIHMKEESHKRTYKEKEAAIYLGISSSSLAKARMSGVICRNQQAPKFIKAGKRVIYLKEDLDEWLNCLPKNRHGAGIILSNGLRVDSQHCHTNPS